MEYNAMKWATYIFYQVQSAQFTTMVDVIKGAAGDAEFVFEHKEKRYRVTVEELAR